MKGITIMYSMTKAEKSGFVFDSEDSFNEYFIEMVLKYGLDCFETSENEVDNLANDIIESYIIPITQWDAEIVRQKNHRTVMFWYLNYVYYMNFDKDTPAGMATDDIYQFFDSMEL